MLGYEITFTITGVCPCCGNDLPQNSYMTAGTPREYPDNPFAKKDRRVFITPCADCFEPKKKVDEAA